MCPHTQVLAARAAVRIRCVIVHEHALVRQALRRLLEEEMSMEIVAEAATAAETLRAVWERSPDLVLGDAAVLRLPAGEAAHWLRRGSANTRVLFFESGLSRSSSKESASYSLGLDSTSAGLRKHMAGLFRAGDTRPAPTGSVANKLADEVASPLTERQSDVVRLMAEGKTVREAAEMLGVSAKTVDTHKTNLMRRLGIHNKAELVLWAVNAGLIAPRGTAARSGDTIPRLARRQAQAMRARSARLETSKSATATTAFTAPTPDLADGRLTHTAGKPRD